jgi:DNA-binding NarL/FixJ family response regulator
MASNKKLRVLIADDSPFIRERLPGMFSELSEVKVVGYAEDGDEAIDSARSLNPDVAILDIRMPGKSGIEVLQELKKDKPGPILIIFTNYPITQYRSKCLDLGADFFFDKSADFDKLFAVLRQLSQEKSQRRKSQK